MNVKCPSCSASLKVNEERLGSRTSAKCPRCQADVPLAPAAQPARSASGRPAAAGGTIVITCRSCGARLKAPAARAGTTSTCPKCHSQVSIQPSAQAAAAAAAGGEHEESSSSAATRRIDSRMLGMIGGPGQRPPAEGVDLDSLVRPEASTAPAPAVSQTSIEPGDPRGLAASLLQPPVGKMERIAEEIRDTAEKMTEPPAESRRRQGAPSQGISPATHPVRPAHDARAAEKQPRVEPAAPADRGHHATAGPRGRLTAVRGLLSGGLAGALIGGAAAGAASSGLAAGFLAPLPVPTEIVPLSESTLRVGLPAVLGALSGFVVAALASERARGSSMILRCAGMGLLMGTACGLVGGLTTGTGLLVWPIAHWMRDLLLVGLLTPAVNRILPAVSSR